MKKIVSLTGATINDFRSHATNINKLGNRKRGFGIVCMTVVGLLLVHQPLHPQYEASAGETTGEHQSGSRFMPPHRTPKSNAKRVGQSGQRQDSDYRASLIAAGGQPVIVDGFEVLTSLNLNEATSVTDDSLRLRLADGRYLRIRWDRHTRELIVEARYKDHNKAENFQFEVLGSYVGLGSKVRLRAGNGFYLAADDKGELMMSSVPYEFTLGLQSAPEDAPEALPQSTIAYDRNGRAYEYRFERLAQQLLRRRAQNKAEFDKILKEVFGENFDHHEAEELRRKMATNDFSWAPVVQVVAPEVLHGNSGAYAASTRTVYLNREIPGKFERAFVYLEELGHHLDTLLKATDSPGDEGALFRIFMTGEQASADELALIRQEDDHGSIRINGKEIEVEFLSCPDWICGSARVIWRGIKSGAGWAWKGAKTAGSAIKTAARGSWDGAQFLASWIEEEGAELLADKFVELCRRSFWTVYQETNTLVNSLVVKGYGTVEGVQVMVEGVNEIRKGNFVDGGAALFVGLAKLAGEVPLDTLSSEVIETLGSLQTVLFLEPEGRYLRDNEKKFLSTVFRDVWWLNVIRVKEGFCGLWSANPRPFTVETIIYLKKWPYSEALMAHESTHVWQYIHGGGDYKWESLYARYWKYDNEEAAYNWQPAVDAGTPWSGLNPEQQAKFVEAAFLATPNCFTLPVMTLPVCPAGRVCRAPTPVHVCQIGTKDRTWFFQNVRSNLWNGDGAP